MYQPPRGSSNEQQLASHAESVNVYHVEGPCLVAG